MALQLVAGCAATPPPPPLLSGRLPSGPVAHFVMAPATADISRPALAAIGQCLAQTGMVPGGTPAYVVQLAHTLRPGRTQVFIPQPQPTPQPAARPARAPRGTIETLTLTVSNIADAQELFRVSAMQPLAGAVPATGAEALADRVCRALAAAK